MAAGPTSPAESAATAAGLTFELLSNAERVASLAGEWNALLQRMPRPSPFLSWGWIATWIKHFTSSSRLWILTARDGNGALTGVAPLHLTRRMPGGWPLRSLEFLGYRGSTVCADHLDFLAAGEQRQRVCAALLAEIARRRGEWDRMTLADLADDSPLPALAGALAPDFRNESQPAELCYYCSLPADFATLLAGAKRGRLNLRNRAKRLAQQGEVRFVAPVPEAEIEATLQALKRLHGLARQAKGQANSFARPAYFGFHRDLMRRLAEDGRLYLARLELNGAACAIFYGFTYGGVLYFYQSGFDPALARFGVGTQQMAAVLEDAITRLHAREFDFLRGAEEYKTYWTSCVRRTRTLRVWNPGLRGRVDQCAWQTGRALDNWRHGLRLKAKPHD